MMKYITLIIVFSVFLIPFRFAYAQMGITDRLGDQEIQEKQEVNAEGLDVVLSDILTAQGSQTLNDIDCNKVENSQLERLGESWMGTIHSDPGVHGRMDQMMGGEGSQTLRAAHVNMGSQYLGCSTKSFGKNIGGFMGMMMPGSGISGIGGMMGSNGNYSFSGFGGIFLFFWLTIWVLIVILLIVLIRYFWKKGSEKK